MIDDDNVACSSLFLYRSRLQLRCLEDAIYRRGAWLFRVIIAARHRGDCCRQTPEADPRLCRRLYRGITS